MVKSPTMVILLFTALLLSGCATSETGDNLAEQAACGWELQARRTIEGGWNDGNFIQLRRPVSLAADISGLWFYDAGHQAVMRLEPTTHALSTILSARLSTDTQLSLDNYGQLFLADPRQGMILRYDESTGTTETFATGINFAPSLLAIDNQGHFLVADDMGGRLLTFNSLGGREDIGGIIEGGRFSRISGLATDGEYIWVSDAVQRRVLGFVEGRLVAELTHPELIQPGPLVIDDNGLVIVGDTMKRQLFVFSPSAPENNTTPLSLPVESLDSLASAFGEVYVADGVGGRIQVTGVVPADCSGKNARSESSP